MIIAHRKTNDYLISLVDISFVIMIFFHYYLYLLQCENHSDIVVGRKRANYDSTLRVLLCSKKLNDLSRRIGLHILHSVIATYTIFACACV